MGSDLISFPCTSDSARVSNDPGILKLTDRRTSIRECDRAAQKYRVKLLRDTPGPRHCLALPSSAPWARFVWVPPNESSRCCCYGSPHQRFPQVDSERTVDDFLDKYGDFKHFLSFIVFWYSKSSSLPLKLHLLYHPWEGRGK